MARPIAAKLVAYSACAIVGGLLHAAWTDPPPAIPEAAAADAHCVLAAEDLECEPEPVECPPAPEPAVCPEPPACPVSACEASPASSVPDPADAPSLPLAGMPGRRRVFTDARWDETDGSWLLVETSDVPVRRERALRFYEKAITGLDMKLIRLPDTDDDGAVRSTVRGRMSKAHVQISLRQAPGEVLTRVRVLWRAWD
jgi:hypothetical protein